MSAREFLKGRVRLLPGDCLAVLPTLEAESVDSVVTDPPYHLTEVPHVKRGGFGGPRDEERKSARRGFMGQQWDGGDIAFRPELWAEALRVLKPGGHLLAFGGSRTYHRMVCAIEDAGFEVRDQIMWVYGSGFPKSRNVSAAIDKEAGAEREVVGSYDSRGRYDGSQRASAGVYEKNITGEKRYGLTAATAPATGSAREWQGWGTALKPAHEPIVLARKPLSERTVAANVLQFGTGALNVDACRVATADTLSGSGSAILRFGGTNARPYQETFEPRGCLQHENGRWPANLIHDGSGEVEAAFAAFGEKTTNPGTYRNKSKSSGAVKIAPDRPVRTVVSKGDIGTASRFFASFPLKEGDLCHSAKFASDAEQLSNAGNRDAVSVLKSAVERSTVGLVLKSIDCQEPYTSVTESGLRHACANATTLIQSIAQKFWFGLPLEDSTLTSGAVKCAATLKQIGTTTITISLSIFVGCAELVTFSIMLTKPELGVQGSAASRFHYTAKADADDRLGSSHPTVKPLDLIQYLVRLITPPGGTVLDCFAGTGTTGEAAFREGMRAILIEREPAYQTDIERRMALVYADRRNRTAEADRARGKPLPELELFAWRAGE